MTLMYLLFGSFWTSIIIGLGFLFWKFLKGYFAFAGHAEPRIVATYPPGYQVIGWSKRSAALKALGFDIAPKKRDNTGIWYDARFNKFD